MADPTFLSVPNIGRAEPSFVFIKDSESLGGNGSFRVLTSADLAGGNTTIAKVEDAYDKVDTFTYLDAGTSDERISTIVHSSASLALSYTETFAYAGSSGTYRISSITRS